MSALEKFFSSNHHAFCVEGVNDVEDISSAICAQWDIVRSGPDMWIRELDLFSVSDAKDLRTFALQASEGKAKAAIISCIDITREAQNALLKTIEEPRGNTKIVISVPRAERLIPTIRSRVEYIRLSADDRPRVSRTYNDAQAFLAADPAARLKITGALAEQKDKREIQTFLDALQACAYEQNDTRMLSAVHTVGRYISDRGASAKLLLEYLALDG